MKQGKTYLVVGGSSGIGLATARKLHEQNAHVIIASRSENNLKSARDKIGNIRTESVDISQESSIASLLANISALDGIVCTAGKTLPGGILELTDSEAKSGFQSKFFGQYYLVKYGISKLNTSGSIILTSGVYSVRPTKNVGILAAVNGALESFVRAMAVELAPTRINALAPGFIDTERLKQVSARDSHKFNEMLESRVPLRRVGTVDEAADGMLYLLSNSYVTGTTLYIDGGVALR